MKQKKVHLLTLLILLLGALFLSVFLPRIPQSPNYHCFADKNSWKSLPNGWNVISNLGFVFAGITGLCGVWHRFRSSKAPICWIPVSLFLGCLLVGFGSSYYHFNPNNLGLFWDRLPMTIVFLSLLSSVISDRISEKAGKILLIPFLLIGIGSVIYWRNGELAGIGDLRFYVLVQYYTIICLLVILLCFPCKTSGIGHERFYWCLMFGLYGIAKLAERLDVNIFSWTHQWISGHTLKHVFAAASVLVFSLMLGHRDNKQLPLRPVSRM